MRFILLTILFASVASAAAGHGGLRLPQEVHTLKQLTPDSYLLYGRGGNVGFVVGDDGVLVIDDQFEDIAQGIVDKIRSVTPKPIRYLINTHHHGDHTGGNPLFAKIALIVAHHDVRKYMLESATANPRLRVEEVAAPSLTYSKEVRVYLGQKTIQVFHVARGHTSGDSVIYFPQDKVAHLGDLFFNRLHPFIDVAHGGSTREWIETLEGVLVTIAPDSRVIPGHGELTDVASLRRFKGYFEALRQEVGEAVRAGKSKEEAVAAVKLSAYSDYQPVGEFTSLAKNAAIVYDELKAGN